MEKSIETIWKQGFMNKNELVAPKINNLYNQKSKDIITRFNRAFNVNIIASFIFSFSVLVLSIFYEKYIAGIVIFILLNSFNFYNIKIKKEIKQLNQNDNTYEYLKSFDNSLKKQISINAKLARFTYPFAIGIPMFIGYGYGFDYGSSRYFGKNSLQVYLDMFSSTTSAFFMLTSLITMISVVLLIFYFGEKLYRFEINLVYGRIFKEIEKILSDIEELRKDN